MTVWRWLALILLAALLARVAFLVLFGDTLSLGASGYDAYAANLIEGQGYTRFEDRSGDSDLPPLYPFFLAGVYTVLGRDPLAVAAVQAVLDLVVVGLVLIIGRRVAGETVGLLAATFYGLYPYLLFQNLSVNDTGLFILLLAAGIALTYTARDSQHWAAAAGVGVALGLAALTKTLVLLLVPLLALWWGRQIGWRTALRLGLAAQWLAAIDGWPLDPAGVHSMPAQAQFNFHPVALFQKFFCGGGARFHIVRRNIIGQADSLHLAGMDVLFFLLQIVKIFSEFGDFSHRGIHLVRHLDQIKLFAPRHLQSVLQRHHVRDLSGEAQGGLHLQLPAGAPRHVVEHHRQARCRSRHRAEVALEPGLRRPVVVGHHGQDGVHARVDRGLGHLHAVSGVVGGGAGDQRHVDRGAHRAEEVDALLVGQHRALARGPGQDQRFVAIVDQPPRQVRGGPAVEGTVGRERGDHRGDDRAETSHQIPPWRMADPHEPKETTKRCNMGATLLPNASRPTGRKASDVPRADPGDVDLPRPARAGSRGLAQAT